MVNNHRLSSNIQNSEIATQLSPSKSVKPTGIFDHFILTNSFLLLIIKKVASFHLEQEMRKIHRMRSRLRKAARAFLFTIIVDKQILLLLASLATLMTIIICNINPLLDGGSQSAHFSPDGTDQDDVTDQDQDGLPHESSKTRDDEVKMQFNSKDKDLILDLKNLDPTESENDFRWVVPSKREK